MAVWNGDPARRKPPTIGGLPLFGLFNKLVLAPRRGESGFAVQILGAKPDVGATTTARALAELAALNIDGPVALVDADPANQTQFRIRGIRPAATLQDVQRGAVTLDEARTPTEIDNLSLFALADIGRPETGTPAWTLSIGALEGILGLLRLSHQWIIVDSAPAQELAFAHVLSRFVDGTVVVVESERTRLPVAQQLIHQIRVNGGAPIGLVINKRKLLISDFLYRFL